MNTKWEMGGKVSTSERVFHEIRKRMPQPVGIILFGADYELKDEVREECVLQIPDLAVGYGGMNANMGLRSAKYPFGDGRSVLTVMHGDYSGDPHHRRETAQAMRDLGAKTVVGIYAKNNMPTAKVLETYSPEQLVNLADQVRILSENPPAADEFDCLVVK